MERSHSVSESTPRVTVCIPVYNRAAYIEEAIESVLTQGFTDFELLLIDDGSTDDSVERMQRFADSDDVMARGRLARQVAFLDANPDVATLGGRWSLSICALGCCSAARMRTSR